MSFHQLTYLDLHFIDQEYSRICEKMENLDPDNNCQDFKMYQEYESILDAYESKLDNAYDIARKAERHLSIVV